MEHYKYSSINQFRNVIADVKHLSKGGTTPTLTFRGSIKVHGTNASVVIKPDGSQYAQGRNKILTVLEDNYGFTTWHHGKKDVFKEYYRDLQLYNGVGEHSVVIYGEWAGRGIQRGVAVSEVDKFFYIYGIKVLAETPYWLSKRYYLAGDPAILNSDEVWRKEVKVDFNNPQLSQNIFTDITNEVEAECPVGKYLGVLGIGEGVVWEHIDEKGRRLKFKVKGDKHSSSKVKKLAEVDVEKVASITEFVEYAVTENRLEQGFNEVCNGVADRLLLGKFIKWVSTDVVKEETDTLVASGLTMKDIGGVLSNKARTWFFSKEEI